MAFTTWRLRDSVGVWFLAPLCLLILSLVTGTESPAYAASIEMVFYETITQPVGMGVPPFAVSHDGVPGATFTHSATGRFGSASVSGSVDLRAGEMHAFATVAGPYSAFATVGMNEVLTFSWADPTRLDPIAVSATFSLDAVFSGSSATASRAGIFSYGFGDVGRSYNLNCDLCFGPLNISNTETILLTPFAPVGLGMSLYIGAGTNYGMGTATFDAGHTAGLSFILPEGATFVSNSGYLLTADPETARVPEPETVWLLGIGLIGMAFTKWKRWGAASIL
jgi:PEP-CTERM motif